jgi:hypothetical protein
MLFIWKFIFVKKGILELEESFYYPVALYFATCVSCSLKRNPSFLNLMADQGHREAALT